MQDGPLSFFKSWEGFLPPNAIVMGKRSGLARDESASTEPSATATESTGPFRFLVHAPGVTRPADHELLEKMMGALGLTLADVCVEERGEDLPLNFAATGARALIQFVIPGDEPNCAGYWEERVQNIEGAEARLPVLSTFSIEAMLRNPGLKKAVWAHLKEAQAK